MSATLARHAEQRQAAAELTELALAETRAWYEYATAPTGAENDFSEDSPHMRWHAAMDAWAGALAEYMRQYGRVAE